MIPDGAVNASSKSAYSGFLPAHFGNGLDRHGDARWNHRLDAYRQQGAGDIATIHDGCCRCRNNNSGDDAYAQDWAKKWIRAVVDLRRGSCAGRNLCAQPVELLVLYRGSDDVRHQHGCHYP